MPENKGKPSGNVAVNKKDVGKQSDIKEIGEQAGAKKKDLSKQPIAANSSHPHKQYGRD